MDEEDEEDVRVQEVKEVNGRWVKVPKDEAQVPGYVDLGRQLLLHDDLLLI